MKNIDKPIFICGYPKSGTTLLTSLLDNHNELLVIPEEIKFFNKVLRQNKDDRIEYLLNHSNLKLLKIGKFRSPSGDRDYSGFDYNIFLEHFFKYWNSSNKGSENILESVVNGLSVALNSNFFKAWVEKTPGTEFHLNTIINWWPNAKFVYLIRDPRQNYCSHFRYQKIKNKPLNITIKRFIKKWKNSVKAFEEFRNRTGKGFLIKYEDLVDNPKRIMENLADYLQIEFRDSLIIPTRIGIQWEGNSSDGKSRNKIENNFYNYDKYLSNNEISIIDLKLRNEIIRYRYALTKEYSLIQKAIITTLFAMNRLQN